MERRAFLRLLGGMLVAAPVAGLILPERRIWALGGLKRPLTGTITIAYEGLFLDSKSHIGVGSTVSIGNTWGDSEVIRLTGVNPDGSFAFEANPKMVESSAPVTRRRSLSGIRKVPGYRALADSPTRAYRG